MADQETPQVGWTIDQGMENNPMPFEAVVAAAVGARNHAHAPYSGFKVGAALETESGEIFTGSNVENASYGLTVCAERVAVGAAVSQGHRAFVRIAVAAESDEFTPPCGACRQVLHEFAPHLVVIGVNVRGTTQHGPTMTWRLEDLLPEAFGLGTQ